MSYKTVGLYPRIVNNSVFSMTKLLELPVIIFVSYIVLLAAGIQEGRYVKHGASYDQHISNEIVNKTIEVLSNTPFFISYLHISLILLDVHIYNSFV